MRGGQGGGPHGGSSGPPRRSSAISRERDVDAAIAPRGWGGAVAPENRARRVGRREQVDAFDAFDAFDKPNEFRDIRAVWEM
ncbi:hypothetical protein ISG05_10650 [Burkholderia pseudomallei]|uniref:hypothetical protein n=1 Tax=Burkholderia pseudomallei TaxID=28450 RepID=UPI00070C3354|nr:hypothetical protein [Burkholderia pseudomallei]ARL53193.1 hypothetical protein BOC51_25630 [Burkholderia pseudomallei]MBF3809650.1 hypothetical protein [Burkholderia pseudomallei]MBF4018115.1 hypothetical protein [Burkholderia pseudomallei]MBF4085223.1 hypothetical protein [Burkholderia pseudomallei]MBF4127586.1 hypothetical protein [Burkholderia pseudomallei]